MLASIEKANYVSKSIEKTKKKEKKILTILEKKILWSQTKAFFPQNVQSQENGMDIFIYDNLPDVDTENVYDNL